MATNRQAARLMMYWATYGYATEYEIERLYRDAPLMSIGEGTDDVLRTVVAKALVSKRTVIG